MSTNSERIVSTVGTITNRAWPLHDVAATRELESQPSGTPASSLMQTAGLALARLTLAVAPHARLIWIACGPGNNGGDGLAAATYLHQWGKQVIVTLTHDPERSPADALLAWRAARVAGVTMQTEAPATFDVCMDALFGIGSLRTLSGPYVQWVESMNRSAAPTIAADIPTGLDANTGTTVECHVRADHTLSLLTLKPGLFMAQGRDACGNIWFHDLGSRPGTSHQALLAGFPLPRLRPHASHKGSYGDLAVVGGANGMTGAALLAGRSALQGGAGRVFVSLLDAQEHALDATHPELMFRPLHALDCASLTVVAGCGGGVAIAGHLATLLRNARQLVLDADALNQLAADRLLQELLLHRPVGSTVLTPHPLEAARLLGQSTHQVQADRLEAARTLSNHMRCTVVLKGSGTVITSPGELPVINPTGNAKLATGGTGDVLAGLVGAFIAQGQRAHDAASAAVYHHGRAADRWPYAVLNASALCQQICI